MSTLALLGLLVVLLVAIGISALLLRGRRGKGSDADPDSATPPRTVAELVDRRRAAGDRDRAAADDAAPGSERSAGRGTTTADPDGTPDADIDAIDEVPATGAVRDVPPADAGPAGSGAPDPEEPGPEAVVSGTADGFGTRDGSAATDIDETAPTADPDGSVPAGSAVLDAGTAGSGTDLSDVETSGTGTAGPAAAVAGATAAGATAAVATGTETAADVVEGSDDSDGPDGPPAASATGTPRPHRPGSDMDTGPASPPWSRGFVRGRQIPPPAPSRTGPSEEAEDPGRPSPPPRQESRSPVDPALVRRVTAVPATNGSRSADADTEREFREARDRMTGPAGVRTGRVPEQSSRSPESAPRPSPVARTEQDPGSTTDSTADSTADDAGERTVAAAVAGGLAATAVTASVATAGDDDEPSRDTPGPEGGSSVDTAAGSGGTGSGGAGEGATARPSPFPRPAAAGGSSQGDEPPPRPSPRVMRSTALTVVPPADPAPPSETPTPETPTSAEPPSATPAAATQTAVTPATEATAAETPPATTPTAQAPGVEPPGTPAPSAGTGTAGSPGGTAEPTTPETPTVQPPDVVAPEQLVAFSAPSAARREPVPGGPARDVDVHVADRGERPLAGVAVSLVDGAGRPAGTATTGDGGDARLQVRGAGQYAVVASVPGYQTRVAPCAVADGPIRVPVTLTRSSVVHGVVRSASGEPRSGVAVSLVQDDEVLAAADSSRDGSFRFTDLSAGHYLLGAGGTPATTVHVPAEADVEQDLPS